MTTKVTQLIGDVDGVNRRFSTPDVFRAGTFRLVWDGVFYLADDEVRGWTEVSNHEIDAATAPESGVVLQGLYETPILKGSPVDPDGILP